MPEDDGESGSVTHRLDAGQSAFPFSARFSLAYRCDLVAMTLATACASVEVGFTRNTGKESFPSANPRADRITEIKCVHVLCSTWSDDDRVRSCYCERCSCGEFCHYLEVRRRDIPDHVELIIYDRQRRDPFVIHELEGIAERFIPAVLVRLPQ